MKNGFSHFDNCHHENFCASVLLMAMEVDEETKRIVANTVCERLGIHGPVNVVAMGREARLAISSEESKQLRGDIWLRFHDSTGYFDVLVELKTHDRWDPEAIASQLRAQAKGKSLARSRHPIRGCVLLAPTHLCSRVNALSAPVPTLEWAKLLTDIGQSAKAGSMTEQAMKHLEKYVERPIGIENRTMADFENATTTVGCLRAFLLACIADIGGQDIKRFNITAESEPFRRDGWAWYGFSTEFKLKGTKHRLGIYKYVESPPGEETAREVPWLEAYIGWEQTPLVYLPFNPSTLAPSELDNFRSAFRDKWAAHHTGV